MPGAVAGGPGPWHGPRTPAPTAASGVSLAPAPPQCLRAHTFPSYSFLCAPFLTVSIAAAQQNVFLYGSKHPLPKPYAKTAWEVRRWLRPKFPSPACSRCANRRHVCPVSGCCNLQVASPNQAANISPKSLTVASSTNSLMHLTELA